MAITTRGGTILPLDQRRRDALANYAELAAREAGQPVQKWVRETWGFKDYEAKDLIRGNASEPMWERIIKLRNHPHGGWRVVIPVLGAVIGESLEDFIATEQQEAARAAEQYRAETAELGQMARDVGALFGLAHRGGDQPRLRDGRTWRARAGTLGAHTDETPVERKSFAPRKRNGGRK